MSNISRFELSRQFHQNNYTMHSAHSHSYFELFYLIQGNCNLFIQDTVYSLSSESIAIIAADSVHKTTYTGNTTNERLNLEFTDDYIPEVIHEFGIDWLNHNFFNKIILVSPIMCGVINDLLSKIMEEHNSADPCAHSLLKVYLETLIILLIRESQNSDYQVTSSKIKLPDESMQKAMNYIGENYKGRITLNDVAEYLELSSSYLSKKFKAVNGIGFSEYLNRVRITHAEKLLIESQMSITEIAFQCGYENSNYFGDAFRHINHLSPSAFRKMKEERGEHNTNS